MADRSYLYSTDHLPESPAWEAKRALHGIAEYRYDIPLVFKILLTGNPVACRSSIWDTSETIAIAGDYAAGRDNLLRYLDRIADPAARPLVEEARAFLNAPAQARKHFILECGEIFDAAQGSMLERNLALLSEIREIGAGLDALPIPGPAAAQRGLLSKLLKLKAPDPLAPYYEIGLGGWSDVLYMDFGEGEGDPSEGGGDAPSQ